MLDVCVSLESVRCTQIPLPHLNANIIWPARDFSGLYSIYTGEVQHISKHVQIDYYQSEQFQSRWCRRQATVYNIQHAKEEFVRKDFRST